MVNRTRSYRKKIWISTAERDRAQRIRRMLGLTDADIYERGLDDLVEAEFQGNVEQMTESKRSRLFFSISIEEWDLLSEAEKRDYIRRLPPKKTRAGGGEMSNRDRFQTKTYANRYMDTTDTRDFFVNEMKIITDRLEKKNRKYIEDREG